MAGGGLEDGAVVLSSDRLILTPFEERDQDELFEIFCNPAVRRFLLDDTEVPLEWVRSEIASSDVRFRDSGAGLWSIRPVDDGGIIGFAGFREFFDPPQLQLLYGLLPEYWGRGLATEAARTVCDHAFRKLGFPHVVAAIDVPNEASGRVLERLGMEVERTTDDRAGQTAFHVLKRESWIHFPTER